MKSRSLLAAIALSSLTTFVPSTAANAVDCAASVQNGGFEAPVMSSLVLGDIFLSGATPVWNGPGAGTTYAMVKALPGVDSAVSQALVWRSTETAVEIQDITPFEGSQYAEIVGVDSTATLYQSVTTVPGVVMDWSLVHRGWNAAGPDNMRVLIGPSLDSLVAQDATPATGVGVTGEPTTISDTNTWREWSGTYTVPVGQTTTVFAFNSISSYSGSNTVGNYIDDIAFTCAADQPAPAVTALPETGVSSLSGFVLAAGAMFGGLALIAATRLKKFRTPSAR